VAYRQVYGELKELDSKKRPNEKYSLSNDKSKNNGEEGIKFYYDRERRLENAPDAVKTIYNDQPPKKNRFSLFAPLIADKPRRLLLFVIVLMCVGIIALTLFGYL
jgi:hypothetical protein